MAPVSGHVFRFEGKRRPVWRAKYRLPDGRQVQKTIGPGLDGARPPAGRLLHEAHRRGVAARRARPGARRDAAGDGPHRRDVRRRLRRVPALHRARPRPQAVDAARLPLDRPRAPPAGVRRRCGSRTSPPSASRRWKAHAADEQPHQGQAAHRSSTASSSAPAASTGCRSTRWPTSRSRATRARDDDRGLLARGGLGARPRRRVRAGRRDLPHRRVHRPAPRRARRAALARRRLRRLSAIRVRASLRRRPPDDAEERQGPLGADGARRRRRRSRGSAERELLDRRRRPRLPRRRRRLPRRLRALAAATRPRSSAPACGRCASTTCATRSARA